MSTTSNWVPTNTCTLPTAHQPLRVGEFAALFATSLREAHRVSTNRLRLVLDGGAGVEAKAHALVASEAQCCTFFRFAVTAEEGDGVTIDVRVPASRTDVLDGLQQQANAVSHHAPTRSV